MRRLTYGIALLATVYGGYWVVGSRAVENGAVAALDQIRAGGVDITYDSLETIGFPSRFDTTLTKGQFRDPATGWGWAGDFLQVFALSYQPNKVIVVAPPEQVIITPQGDVVLKADGLRASLSVGVATDAPLSGLIVESGAGSLAPSDAPGLTFAKLLGALRPTETPNDYAAFVEVTALALPGVIAPVDLARFDTVLTLTRPLDRHLGTGAPVGIAAIALTEGRVVWGGGVVTAQGAVTVDAAGYPVGEIALTATGWERMIEAAVAAGWVASDIAPRWISMGSLLAKGGADISMPLIFAEGQMALGPFPLGPAPRLK